MKKKNFHRILLIIIPVILLYGCRGTKDFEKNQCLLNKNKIKINTYKLSYDELYSYLKPKPNRRMLGVIKFNYWVYKMADWGRDNKFKLWLKNTIGEEPVFLDSLQVGNSIKQLNLYLNRKGYFNSEIASKVRLRNKKANVTYYIKTKKPYTYRNISFKSKDKAVENILNSDSLLSLIRFRENYDEDLLEHERERITNLLKDHGYYKFSKEYIYYEIDSTPGSRQMDIAIEVKNTDKGNHSRYRVEDIFLYPDFDVLKKDTTRFDTLRYTIFQRRNKKNPLNYYLLYRKKLNFKPKTLTQAVFIKNYSYFNLKDVQETYNSISALQNFKFININFDDIPDKPDSNQLDCRIRLTRLPRQSFTIETEGTNSLGDLGIAGNLGYENINLFHGAEIFSLKLKLAMEVQNVLVTKKTSNFVQPYLPFNTVETGVESNIEIPKFLIPLPQETFAQYNRPKTNINIGLNYQRRSEFRRIISNISFGYKFRETSTKTWVINPVEISAVNIDKETQEFINTIDSLKDINLQNSYKNHLTAGGRYSFIFNSQELKLLKDFSFFRINLKTAGNLLYFLDKNFVKPDTSPYEYYRIFRNRYAQFLRLDADFRYYNIINNKNTIVYRAIIGTGIPYGNMNSLPFEESFSCGGANDIRAWEIRSLGPGSYHDADRTRFDKTGDIKIEGNIEYRFPIYKLIKGAAFLDAGNVWLKNKNNKFSGGDFQIKRFYKEIAFGGGIGTRLDFSFFIIRVDAAIPFKDPSNAEGQRWVIKGSGLDDIILNLGIGYPF